MVKYSNVVSPTNLLNRISLIISIAITFSCVIVSSLYKCILGYSYGCPNISMLNCENIACFIHRSCSFYGILYICKCV